MTPGVTLVEDSFVEDSIDEDEVESFRSEIFQRLDDPRRLVNDGDFGSTSLSF